MADYIDRDAFIAEKRMHFCATCKRRQGMKNGKMQFCYEIGGAPCRACDVADMLDYIEDFPAADVVEVVRCKDCIYSDEYFHCSVVGLWTTESDFCSRGKRNAEDIENGAETD